MVPALFARGDEPLEHAGCRGGTARRGERRGDALGTRAQADGAADGGAEPGGVELAGREPDTGRPTARPGSQRQLITISRQSHGQSLPGP